MPCGKCTKKSGFKPLFVIARKNMKTRKKFGAILLLVALLAAVIAFLLPSASPAYAAGAYSFEITNFTATYEVHSDRTIDIEGRLTIHYTG